MPRALPRSLLSLVFLATVAPFAGAAPETSPRAISRSALGYLLDVRIDVPGTSDVSLDPACFVLAEPTSGPSVPPLHTLRISIVELRAARYLRIESREPTVEPLARVAIRAGCPGEATELREFLVAIDPDPRDSSIVRPQSAAQGATTVPLATNPLRVRPGDTLDSVARNIYPRDRKRRAQLIEALRSLNPSLAGVPGDRALDSLSELAFPDLKALSARKPPATSALAPQARPARPSIPPPEVAPPPAARPPVVPATPAKAAAEPPSRQAARPATTPRTLPVELAPAVKADSTAAAKAEQAPRSAAAKPAAGSEIRLRLSGAEVDLSRTRGISEERRRELRQRRALLDADDQMSALLSMQNTVRQLETRLQDVQLKMTTSASQPAPAVPAVPRPSPPPASAATASAIPGGTLSAAPEPAKPAASEPAKSAESSPATPPAPTKPLATPEKAASAPPATAAMPSTDEPWAAMLPSPWILGGAGALLVALLGLWGWTRRSTYHPPQGDRSADVRSDDDLPVLHDVHTAPPAALATPERGRASTATAPAQAPELVRPETTQAEEAAQSAIDELEMLSEPASASEAPAMLVVDATPAGDLDLPLDDRSAEDRVRRLEYMHGRFPELKSRTISIEEPDSVISAARLYLEEQQRDRACELLTYGVEERPQEVRYWLAQFEIFRLENMAGEFTQLAGKFHVLFAHTPHWPKVCHIGRELDPGNPLFAAGRDVLAEDGQFDPVAENWLNAPMDFTADALMSDLRRELFDDHNVDRADFASLSQRLSEVRAQ